MQLFWLQKVVVKAACLGNRNWLIKGLIQYGWVWEGNRSIQVAKKSNPFLKNRGNKETINWRAQIKLIGILPVHTGPAAA